MNKKLLPIVFALVLPLFSIAQHDHEKNKTPKAETGKPFDMKTAKSPYLHQFDANLLSGFDEAAAMRKALARTQKPAEQKEYFESMVRQYVASHTPPSPVGHGNQPFTSFYDAGSKTINVNLTPYSGYCPNAGFENMNFGGWTGDTYTNSGALNWNTFTPAWVPGIVTTGNNNPPQANWPAFPAGMYPNRHTIMTIPPTLNNPPNVIGWDSVAIKAVTHLSEIEFVPPTANGATCRLGNANNNYNETERLVYSMNVSPSNNQFTYSYAVVIYDGGHMGGEQPFFKITARDQNGNSIGGACGIYQIDATQVSTDPTFYAAATYWGGTWTDPTPGGFNSYYYKKWSTVGIDLSAYNGQNVTIEFQTGDCIFGGHWCYAYVDASCQPSQITLNYCPGSSVAYAVGPDGYSSYQWYGPNTMVPIAGQTNDTLVVNGGNVGDVYTLIAASASGCTSTMQVTLIPTSVGVQNTFSTPSCATGSSGSATVVPMGSSSGYTFAWSNSSGPIPGNTGTINSLPPGTYSVHVSAPGCGFKDTSIVVGITPPIFLTTTQNICGNPYVVNAPAGSGYTWYDVNLNVIASAQGITPLLIPNTGNTSATVVYTNLSGCRDSMKINVTQQINYSTQNVSYCGNTATLSVMAGATNINWHDANWPYPSIGTGQTVTIPNPISSMWQGYTVAYTNPTTGCQDSIQFYLTQITGSAFASNIINSCLSPSATGGATVNLSTAQASPYTYVISGNNGYSNTVSNTASTSIPLTGLDTGAYSITITAGTCAYTGSFNIHAIPVPVTIATNPLCVPTGGTSVVTFSYGAGGTGSCAAATTPCASTTLSTVGSNSTQNFNTGYPCPYGNWYSNEKYQILYTAADLNSAGITGGKISDIAFDVASIPVGMNQTFINYTIKISCTPTTDLGVASWGTSTFITAPFVTVWGPQNYTVATGINTHTFSTAYDWDGTSSIIVEICYDWVAPSTYTYNAIMNNTPTPYYSFALFNSDSQPSCPTTTMNQTFMERPVTRFNTCLSQSLASDFTYSWTPTAGIQAPTSPTNSNPTVSIISSNSQHYQLTTTTNIGGCTKIDTFTINVVIPFNLAVTGDATVCSNSPALPLQATTTDPTTGNPLTVAGSWSGSNAVTNLGNGTGSFNPATAGPGTYTLVYSAGAAACGGISVVQDTVHITVHPYLLATFTPFGPFCESAPVTILGPQAANPGGTWSVNGVAATQFEPSILGPSTAPGHNVTYTIDQGFGCPNSSSNFVMVYSDPVVTFLSDITAGCMPSLPVTFTSNVTVPGGTYAWTFGDAGTAALANPVHIYNQVGVYPVSVTYTSPNGCVDNASISSMITVNNIPNPDFTSYPTNTTTLDPHIYFTNTTQNAAGLIWNWDIAGLDSASTLNTDYEFPASGQYFVTLTATDLAGCFNTITHPVYIEPDHVLYIPSGFSPNEDGKNDLFIPQGDGVVNDGYKMSIYNRWGEKIFETDDITIGWNGARNNIGEREECEVYVYRIIFKDQLSKSYTRTGHVTLMR